MTMRWYSASSATSHKHKCVEPSSLLPPWSCDGISIKLQIIGKSRSIFQSHVICVLIISGGAICYECNSKANQCAPESLNGAIKGACARGKDYCAVYKKEPPGNISSHQFTRYCASECEEDETIYFTGGKKTKNCIMCCKGDFCNNYLYDPCNPPSDVLQLKSEMLTVLTLSLIAIKLMPC